MATNMRVTTLLILEHIKIEPLAFLTESYLVGPYHDILYSTQCDSKNDDEEVYQWRSVGIGGHVELIADSIERFKNGQNWLVESIVKGVCLSGDRKVIKMISSMGISNFSQGLEEFLKFYKKDFNGRNLRVVKLLMALGGIPDSNAAFRSPAKQQDISICHFLINKDYQSARFATVWYAGYYGDLSMLKFGTVTIENKVLAVRIACKYGQLDFVKHFPELTSYREYDQVTERMGAAIAGDISAMGSYHEFTNDHANVVEYMLSHGACINQGVALACVCGAVKSFKVLVKYGATHCSMCNRTIAEHTDEYLAERRANYIAPYVRQ